jgi:carboxypeptidase C (cathepsin A)
MCAATVAAVRAEDKAADPGKGLLRLLPRDAASDKTLNAGGRTLRYRAVAGTLPIFSTSGDQKAAIFYTAYTLEGADAARRPLTFAFNGGPGAASAFLHLGVAGPRIADFGPSGREGAAATLRDNPQSWLAFTDLVFIDPIGSGWSRADKEDTAKEYFGVSADAQVMAKVVALYVARHARSASPKYLLGESYGGFRAARTARVLQQDQGIVASGIVMVSPLLETGYTFGGDRLSLGCALQLPSIVAAELEFRHALTPEKLAEAERFAMTEYLTTLAGRPPQDEAGRPFYSRVAEMTGLPVETVEKARGCVRDAYLNHRRDRARQSLSAYDASFGVDDPYPDSDRRRGADPVLDGFVRALGGLFADYARNELGFKTDVTYSLRAGEVSRRWDWERGGRGGGQGVSDDIRELLALNPSFRLLVTHGSSDLVTPHMVSRYILDHIPQIGGPDRVQLKVYSGGHMFYLADPARIAFTQDAKAFYQRSE